jgi:hypothetical protein
MAIQQKWYELFATIMPSTVLFSARMVELSPSKAMLACPNTRIPQVLWVVCTRSARNRALEPLKM